VKEIENQYTSGLVTAGTTVGSIAGAGLYRIGSKQLTVGTTNLSTTVSGIIADGGAAGGTGGSLVKVGTGTLTLPGNISGTGNITFNGSGTVDRTLNLGGAPGDIPLVADVNGDGKPDLVLAGSTNFGSGPPPAVMPTSRPKRPMVPT
jgi:hypothetical protein